MTPQEFDYIRRAMAVLEDPETTPWAQHKIYKTVSQIFDMNAQRIEDRMIDRFDTVMQRQYQDAQNDRLLNMIRGA
jgi:hypothetical protein